jgi:hypothetical protein
MSQVPEPDKEKEKTAPAEVPKSAIAAKPAEGAKPAEAAKEKDQAGIEAKIYGETNYDRVSSMLIAVVLGALIVFGWLSIIAATTSAYQSRVSQSIEVIEVSGGGGGTPEGKVASVEEINVAGGETADKASNNEDDASQFEEPSVEARPAAMLDTVMEAGQNLAEVDVAQVMPNGGKVASGKRKSKVGNGGPGYGFGPGDGGVRREDRWSILYKTGQTADEYARQLDAFGVELAIPSGNQLIFVSNFSQVQPSKRTGSPVEDKRLYFVWQGQGRKESDIALLSKAGLQVGESVIFQFYPARTETILEQLEVRHKGKQPAEIRKTRFGVVQSGNGYAFEVLSQDYLR